MANAITTTLTVQFGQDSQGHLTAEIDGRTAAEGGLNSGNNSFVPGDIAYFLVYKSTGVTIDSITTSDGSVSYVGTAVVPQEDVLIFSNERQASINKPLKPGQALTKVWMGTDLGALSVASDQGTVTSATSGVAVAKVNYNSDVLIYSLNSPLTSGGLDEFTINILIVGSNA